MNSYNVVVSRDVVETTTVNVRAANENDAVDQALIFVCNNVHLSWERLDLTYQPAPYATVYDVEAKIDASGD